MITKGTDWQLSEGEIRWCGIRIDITPRQVRVLHHLARRAPAIVTAAELNRMTTLPGTPVPDTASVMQLIVDLRRRLKGRNVPCPFISKIGRNGGYHWIPS